LGLSVLDSTSNYFNGFLQRAIPNHTASGTSHTLPRKSAYDDAPLDSQYSEVSADQSRMNRFIQEAKSASAHTAIRLERTRLGTREAGIEEVIGAVAKNHPQILRRSCRFKSEEEDI
jgi:hypothetical protein